MIEKLMTLLVGILLTLAGWSLSRTFQLSTIQAVHEDKVERLEKHVDKLQVHIENMMKSDEEIIKDIKSTLETKVKDNVATHGGEIKYKIIWGSTKHND